MTEWIKIPMKFPGTCIICNDKIEINEIADWAKGLGVKHEKCTLKQEDKFSDKPNSLPEYFTLTHPGPFKIINDPNVIEIQQLKIQDYFKNNLTKSGKTRLSHRGKGTFHSDKYFPVVDAYYNSKYDIWWSDKIDPTYKSEIHKTIDEFENPKHFKNVLGMGEPEWRSKSNKNSKPVLEINFNKDGTHTTHGYILEKNGDYYLGIDKTIGGNYDSNQGKLGENKGEIEEYFLQFNEPVIKKPQPIFLIAEINEKFIQGLSEFVINIKIIKDNRFEIQI
jgi:hypothetical protein